MTWLRERLRQWLGIDSDIATVVDLVASVEKSVINRCEETQSYCVGGLAAHNVDLMAHARALATLGHDGSEHNQRLLDLREALVKLETKPDAPKQEPEPRDPAGSWSRVRLRAERGQDAA